MASSRPRRETVSLYGRPCPPVLDEGSGLGVASIGGQRRRTRVRRRKRTPSPPPSDEVMEEEHVTATASSSSEDERGQQMGEGDEALEGEGGEALEGKGEGTATRTLYERGPASLPPVPLPHNRSVIRPMAKR